MNCDSRDSAKLKSHSPRFLYTSIMSASILAAAAKAAGIPTGKGSDSRFFSTTKKGELHELKEELNSPKLPIKRDASKLYEGCLNPAIEWFSDMCAPTPVRLAADSPLYPPHTRH
jgi:hypothetical protein